MMLHISEPFGKVFSPLPFLLEDADAILIVEHAVVVILCEGIIERIFFADEQIIEVVAREEIFVVDASCLDVHPFFEDIFLVIDRQHEDFSTRVDVRTNPEVFSIAAIVIVTVEPYGRGRDGSIRQGTERTLCIRLHRKGWWQHDKSQEDTASRTNEESKKGARLLLFRGLSGIIRT